MGFQLCFLLVSLLAGGLAFPSSDSDLSIFFDHTSGSRIVGGSVAAQGSAPYMVALSNGLLIRSYFCGGSLVTNRHILTAAHCIAHVFSFGSLSNSLRATVGTNRWNVGGVHYNLARNISHPNYVANIIKNDLGFLVTTANVVLGGNVQLVALNYDWIGGNVATRVFGWGNTRVNGAISPDLLELSKRTVEGAFCVSEVARLAVQLNIRNVPAVQPHIELCTFHSVNHGTCNGDSGGPLMRTDRNQQIGIVSWGLPCARGAPDMFVRVSAYRDWILRSIN